LRAAANARPELCGEPGNEIPHANYFLYQRIATATKITVMIQRMMSLLRFFSFASAMQGSTPQCPLSIQVVFSARIV
jgi:hypothetical protein